MGEAKLREDEIAALKANGAAQVAQVQIDHQAMQRMQMLASKEAVFINGFSIDDSGSLIRITFIEGVGYVAQPRCAIISELKEALAISDGLAHVVKRMAEKQGIDIESLRDPLTSPGAPESVKLTRYG